ncbi:winged helix-turn-helix domain-containing protein [Mangrovibrevibacter kandeliae]|uniref:winged helix-turn-helix domain-containing protein n=1 Tax=Mangrovibrevibacter kandeliae TaxID=2968473 RepID=UPI0021181B6D|nr:winged helix-turn-helix domain-containing protein [Aurantimonas sp. CSK15Z-1]MCQ8783539.1 winged helix-turn-helix domain-containing protein [Aurantimonas sp. CSK15Z-1]
MRGAAPSQDYRQWVEHALRALGPSTPAAVYKWIRNNEPVPAADLSGSTADGENLFEKNVRWARFQLAKEGAIVGPKRGIWALK